MLDGSGPGTAGTEDKMMGPGILLRVGTSSVARERRPPTPGTPANGDPPVEPGSAPPKGPVAEPANPITDPRSDPPKSGS